MKRLFTTLILTVCMLPLVKADVVGGDNAGANISWSFDTETHVLTLTGDGDMYDCQDIYQSPWWNYRQQIWRVAMSEGITRIGVRAFCECTIDTITFPASITSVGADAFYKCKALKCYNVANGNTVYSAHDGVLYSADGTRIILFPYGKDDSHTTPMTLTVLSDGIVDTKIKELYLPGVVEVDSNAIRYCHNLERIIFSDALDTIALGAIQRCPCLNAIGVPESNQRYTIVDSVLYTKDTTLLIKFPEYKEYVDVDNNTGIYTLPIAPQVKRIGDYAFSYCNSQRLIFFSLPEGLEQIDSRAFYGSYCFGTFVIDAWNGNIPAVTTETFQFYGDKELYVPYDDYKVWAADTIWNKLNLHFRPQDVYGGNLNMSLIHWQYTTATKTLELTGSGPMPTFCDADYYGWWLLRDSIATCTVADGITSIGMNAFVGDTLLTSINFPESIVEISYHAFDGCKNLTIPELPSGLRAIYDYAFRGCQHTPVWSQQFPSTLEHIGKANYVGLQYPTAIYMPISLKYIGDSAFACCPNVEYIHFLDAQVEHIGNYAFVDCPKSGLSCNNNKGLPSTVEYIGDYAFAISGIPVSSQQKYMPYNLPDSLQHIGQGAFRCRTLSWTNIMTLPEHLTYIGDSAFIHANKCTEVRIAARVAPTIGPHTFPATLGLVSVPMGALNSYTAAANWSQLPCHIGNFTMKAGSDPTASSIEIYLQCNESEAAKIDHLEAKNYDVVMYQGSHTGGYVIGLKPETNYDLEVYAISTAGDRERFNINATTAGVDLFRADVQRVDSFFRFSTAINMPGLKDGMGFELQAVEDYHPVGDTVRLMAKIEYDGAAQISFYADTILLNYGQIGECKYRVRAFYYDAQNNRIYYPSDALPDDTWTWVNIEESYWPYVAPIFTVDTVSVSATEMTLKVQFESLGSATISSIDVQVEESQVTASVPFDGNKEQVFTVSGFTPETSYNIWINIMSPQVEYPIGNEFLMHITTRPAPTGIEDILSDKSYWSDKSDSAKKILHNGQIYILRGGKAFDITGQQVK
ncbi:MAG: leucine-rich repeat protein [Paludibacteraceae bacterium]|nr:leucine-rich repeat protein [Paludibacteraceae bacterium]